MMNFILEDVFRDAGRNVEDCLEFQRLDPLYRLIFPDNELLLSPDHEKTAAEIRRVFPGEEARLPEFFAREEKRFRRMFPCLQMPYQHIGKLFHPNLLKALPRLSLGKSLWKNLGRYFGPDILKLSFTFQSKYLGMSPWQCPAAFTILPYVEHAYGIYHVTGGLNRISQAMTDLAREHGAEIHLQTPVRQLWTEGKTVRGVLLEDGGRVAADRVVLNADFAHAMCELVQPGLLRKWGPRDLERRALSCSTFMLYLGLDKRYDIPHHNIVFARDYHTNVRDIFETRRLSDDLSLYIQNASVTDPTLAPEGKSTLYVLVPVPNLRADLDWNEIAPAFRDRVLDIIESRTELSDLRRHIETEKVLTPLNWRDDYNVYAGATFNLAHNIGQMLLFRPGNRFRPLRNLYLVGGGTHPGSGLPTIYESGRISANLISAEAGVAFDPPSPLAEKRQIHPA
jgi:phytoene desaturase